MIASNMFDTKPQSKHHHYLEHWEQTSAKFESKCKIFTQENPMENVVSKNGRLFVSALIC